MKSEIEENLLKKLSSLNYAVSQSHDSHGQKENKRVLEAIRIKRAHLKGYLETVKAIDLSNQLILESDNILDKASKAILRLTSQIKKINTVVVKDNNIKFTR